MHSDQYILVTFVMTELGHMTVEFLLPKSDSMEMTSDVKSWEELVLLPSVLCTCGTRKKNDSHADQSIWVTELQTQE